MTERSANFGFLLDGHDPVFHRLALSAEQAAFVDPNTTVLKLRQFGEALAKHAAAAFGVWAGPEMGQLDLLRALESRRYIEGETAQLFHHLRRQGNAAAHDFAGSRQMAIDQLRLARRLAVWFHRTFGGPDAQKFKPGPFVAPEDPSARVRALQEELAQARAEAETHRTAAADARRLSELEAQRRAAAEDVARRADAERAEWEQLAAATEQESQAKEAAFQGTLARLQEEAATKPEQERNVQAGRAAQAAAQLDLDEAETRLLIDDQLRAAGWEADSRRLRHGLGTRPEKGRRVAIAEWPTDSGPADYVLFDGTTPIAVVEAKRRRKNVVAAIDQGKRYALDFHAAGTTLARLEGFPAFVNQPGRYLVPFIYATNGRPYLRQVETESGIWFLDARQPTNHPRALDGWHTPDGLRAMLAEDPGAADDALTKEPTDYLLLRDYQLRAIGEVESALAAGRRELLVAMATGTGKTRTIVGLIYRLLKTKRARRVLFLVDRSALGEQAQSTFKEMRLEGSKAFAEIYEVRELGDVVPEPETRVHVSTVQGMVRRIFGGDADEGGVPIDRYDCIIVDESHRGYTLDREMTEGEQELRGFTEYVSMYRRVLDHFDAIKIGLTATPALHTREILGDPVYTYSYREAVVDGWLVDHEPPVQIYTRLAEQGIHFEKGSAVKTLRPDGAIQLDLLPDELDFDVEDFNKQVLTEGFNRAVAKEVAGYFDPGGREKMLVFCVNDRHADIFVHAFKAALEERWGPLDDGAVRKITGSIDRPLEAIRRYKNEQLPTVAVTVDLLTTGVDVPPIAHLVFLRRVRSRILYEQMIGRATRLCDEIGKEIFHIYDAVALYDALEPFTSMKPVVKNVHVPLRQLVDELVNDASHAVAGSYEARSHADDVLDQIVTRVRRAIRRGERRQDSQEWTSLVESFEAAFDGDLAGVPARLHRMGAIEVGKRLATLPELGSLLERLTEWSDSGTGAVVYEGEDEVVRTEIGYGPGNARPEDYLEGFGRFVRENLNLIQALGVVVARPRDLTREQLKELRLKLDVAGYTEPALRAAWRHLKNEDIAATIIGFIRRQALGSPLVPYSERVDRALKSILASQPWKPPERKWLERIAEQMKKEVVLDEAAFEKGAFANFGGWKGVDRALGGRLSDVLAKMADDVWADDGAGVNTLSSA